MLSNPLPIWLFFAVLAYLARRDRRWLARWPLTGLVGLGFALILYVAWRLTLRPGPPTEDDAAFLQAALVFSGGFALPLVMAWGRALVMRDMPRAARWLRREADWILTCGVLAVVSAGVYFAFGTQLAARGVFAHYDTLFWSDPIRISRILSNAALAGEHFTHKHPLFPLIGHGLFCLAHLFVGPDRAPLAVSSAAGGACLALAAAYFRHITGSRSQAVLAALVLGSTTAHLVFAATPETYTLSAAALILVHWLLARRSTLALRFRHQVVAAVLAVGMTLTNLVPAIVCFAGRHPAHRRGRALLRWLAATVLLGGLGVAVQSALLPESMPGKAPPTYLTEQNYFTTTSSAWAVLRNLGRGLLLENIVGAAPRVLHVEDKAVLCPGPYGTWPARLTLALWILIGIAALLTLPRVPAEHRPTLWAAVLCLAATAAIHSVYGDDYLFLYSCTYTFYVLSVVAHALPHWKRPWATAALGLLLVALAIQNSLFAADILKTLDRLAPG